LSLTEPKEINSSGSGQGPVAGFCKHSSELLGSMKGWEFLVQCSNHQLLKEDAAPLN